MTCEERKQELREMAEGPAGIMDLIRLDNGASGEPTLAETDTCGVGSMIDRILEREYGPVPV